MNLKKERKKKNIDKPLEEEKHGTKTTEKTQQKVANRGGRQRRQTKGWQTKDGKQKVANEGDIVLIQRLPDVDWKMSDSVSLKETAEGAWWEPKVEENYARGGAYTRKDVTHQVLEVIYKLGDVIEPTTKKPVVADRYRSEIAKTAKLYGKSNSDFDYNKAPQRGSQKDKRDFTHRKTYKKWHQFPVKDPYAIIS